MKKDKSAKSELCYIWAKAFCIDDKVSILCRKNHKSIDKVLIDIGLEFTDFIMADIYEVDYDGEDFSVSPYSCGYFPGKDVGDIVSYNDLLRVENTYKLIPEYVSESYKNS